MNEIFVSRPVCIVYQKDSWRHRDFERGAFNEKAFLSSIIADPLEGDFFEGDINGVKLTSVNDEDEVLSYKNAIKNTFQKWPEGEIPYVISDSFGSYERSVIRAAMEQFDKHSCVKWRPHVPTDVDYVHILRHQGCYSRVGRTGGPQILSLGT